MHWTQRPENREKLKAAIAAGVTKRPQNRKGHHKGVKRKAMTPEERAAYYQSAAFRKKMSIAMKRRWKNAKRKGTRINAPVTADLPVNGFARDVDRPYDLPELKAGWHGKLARESLHTLAAEGARHRLAALDREREMLVIFLQKRK